MDFVQLFDLLSHTDQPYAALVAFTRRSKTYFVVNY